MLVKKRSTRRHLLRGMMGGAAVSVGLPFLDWNLNSSGTALANGASLPVCFGTWFNGLGFTPGFWEPEVVGANYTMKPLLSALEPFKEHINIFSGLQAYLDGKPAAPHATGPKAILTGDIPRANGPLLASVDSLIADVISARTRFKSLEATCDGSRFSYSRRGGNIVNPAETSPLALYNRIFGPEFSDPNAAEFIPDPEILARRSALSVVEDERKQVMKLVGASDKTRLDEYFTSLRSLEQQLELLSRKPDPMPACEHPDGPSEAAVGPVVDDALSNHKLFAQLLAHALACGQTNVVNMVLSNEVSGLRRAGSSQTYHMDTHEEAVDPELGYQKRVHWYADQVLTGFATFLDTLQSYKEGDATLLDRIVVFYATDNGYAKIHSLTNIPLITAGRAGGRLKGGMHVKLSGDTVARVGLTLQQALGVPVSSWGTDSNNTSKPIAEIMA